MHRGRPSSRSAPPAQLHNHGVWLHPTDDIKHIVRALAGHVGCAADEGHVCVVRVGGSRARWSTLPCLVAALPTTRTPEAWGNIGVGWLAFGHEMMRPGPALRQHSGGDAARSTRRRAAGLVRWARVCRGSRELGAWLTWQGAVKAGWASKHIQGPCGWGLWADGRWCRVTNARKGRGWGRAGAGPITAPASPALSCSTQR